jgi:hypothetical protein
VPYGGKLKRVSYEGKLKRVPYGGKLKRVSYEGKLKRVPYGGKLKRVSYGEMSYSWISKRVAYGTNHFQSHLQLSTPRVTLRFRITRSPPSG